MSRTSFILLAFASLSFLASCDFQEHSIVWINQSIDESTRKENARLIEQGEWFCTRSLSLDVSRMQLDKGEDVQGHLKVQLGGSTGDLVFTNQRLVFAPVALPPPYLFGRYRGGIDTPVAPRDSFEVFASALLSGTLRPAIQARPGFDYVLTLNLTDPTDTSVARTEYFYLCSVWSEEGFALIDFFKLDPWRISPP